MVILHEGNGISMIKPIRLSSCNYLRGQYVYVMGSGGIKPSVLTKANVVYVSEENHFEELLANYHNSWGNFAVILQEIAKFETLLLKRVFFFKGVLVIYNTHNGNGIGDSTPSGRVGNLGRLLPAH